MLWNQNTAPPLPILQCTSECHLMSQRGNSGHHPEVTIQLNHYFYFIFTKKQGPSPKAQQPPWAALCDLMLLHTGCGATRSSWALSLLWVLDCYRSGWCGAPQPCPLCWGSSAVPRRAEGPQPHCLGEQSCGSALLSGLGLCSCRWTGMWALTCTCTASGNASQVDRSHAHGDSVELSQYPLNTDLILICGI